MAIGEGWFRDAGGALAVPVGDRRRTLGLVGRALRQPREIRLRWVTGLDGQPLVFRRYIARLAGIDIVVDVSRTGWRFASSLDPGFDLAAMSAGELIWPPPNDARLARTNVRSGGVRRDPKPARMSKARPPQAQGKPPGGVRG